MRGLEASDSIHDLSKIIQLAGIDAVPQGALCTVVEDEVSTAGWV